MGRGFFPEGTGFIYRAIVESNSSDLFEIFLNNTGEKFTWSPASLDKLKNNSVK